MQRDVATNVHAYILTQGNSSCKPNRRVRKWNTSWEACNIVGWLSLLVGVSLELWCAWSRSNHPRSIISRGCGILINELWNVQVVYYEVTYSTSYLLPAMTGNSHSFQTLDRILSRYDQKSVPTPCEYNWRLLIHCDKNKDFRIDCRNADTLSSRYSTNP